MGRATRKYSSDKKARQGYYGCGLGLYLSDQILTSHAWRILTAAQKVILVECLRRYNMVSGGDRKLLPDGFNLPPSCSSANSNTFYAARKRFVAVGWFELKDNNAGKFKEGMPCLSESFVPSTKWSRYEPTKAELARLDAKNTAKRIRACAARKRLKERAENRKKWIADKRVMVFQSLTD